METRASHRRLCRLGSVRTGRRIQRKRCHARSRAGSLALVLLATNAEGLRTRIPVLKSSNKAVAAAGWEALLIGGFVLRAVVAPSKPATPRPPQPLQAQVPPQPTVSAVAVTQRATSPPPAGSRPPAAA